MKEVYVKLARHEARIIASNTLNNFVTEDKFMYDNIEFFDLFFDEDIKEEAKKMYDLLTNDKIVKEEAEMFTMDFDEYKEDYLINLYDEHLNCYCDEDKYLSDYNIRIDIDIVNLVDSFITQNAACYLNIEFEDVTINEFVEYLNVSNKADYEAKLYTYIFKNLQKLLNN